MSRARIRWIALAFAVVASAITLWFLYRGEGDTLSRDALDAARARWKQSQPGGGYELEVVVSGTQNATHQVTVRDGRVVAMTTNGIEVAERLWPIWSVEGMFATLATELRNAADPKMPYGVDDPSDVVLQVAFDDRYGYPRRFLRHVLGGRRNSIEWEVTRFDAK